MVIAKQNIYLESYRRRIIKMKIPIKMSQRIRQLNIEFVGTNLQACIA